MTAPQEELAVWHRGRSRRGARGSGGCARARGDRYRGRGGGPGRTSSVSSRPIPKNGKRKERRDEAAARGEKRGSGEPSPLHLGEASGRRRRAGSQANSPCGPKLGETTGGQPPPKTAGAPESRQHPPGPIPTAPAPGLSAFYSRSGLLEAPRL